VVCAPIGTVSPPKPATAKSRDSARPARRVTFIGFEEFAETHEWQGLGMIILQVQQKKQFVRLNADSASPGFPTVLLFQ
jgi:hypothetical protein